jgi:hypothetical protein
VTSRAGLEQQVKVAASGERVPAAVQFGGVLRGLRIARFRDEFEASVDRSPVDHRGAYPYLSFLTVPPSPRPGH